MSLRQKLKMLEHALEIIKRRRTFGLPGILSALAWIRLAGCSLLK